MTEIKKKQTPMNSSARINKLFMNEVSAVSINAGVELHIAKNVVRFRKINKKTMGSKRVWTDTKSGLPLTVAQWTGPALKRYNQVKNGTDGLGPVGGSHATSIRPDLLWDDAENMGMANIRGLLLSAEECDLLVTQILTEKQVMENNERN